ncbi:hypothetical protein [Cohnella sp.]|uniref:hypothetical protein n=1 Tax=Cohnella sp. TaxID=1883426 RepID=UPI0035634CD6
MQRASNGVEGNEIYVYLMAGVATAPHFMEKFRAALHEKLAQSGRSVHSELLFPYGDWSRRVVPQLWEIRYDMRLSFSRFSYSIGGNRLLSSILSQLPMDRSHRTIFIGHSGGGVAAVHAAQLMLEKHIGSEPSQVVMIGSPRVRIPDNLQSSVLSLYATGKSRDLVSRLGTFGGWSSELRRFPIWQADKHAPVNIQGLPIIGGHPDYFRDRAPYVNAIGKSNIDITLEAIEQWLYPFFS